MMFPTERKKSVYTVLVANYTNMHAINIFKVVTQKVKERKSGRGREEVEERERKRGRGKEAGRVGERGK